MEYRYNDGTTTHTVRIVQRREGFEVCIGDRSYAVTAREVDATTLDLWIDGAFQRSRHAEQGLTRWLRSGEEVASVTRQPRRRRQHATGEGDDILAAEMPGQIVAVLVTEGAAVTRGQPLVIMEAMKMELKVAAPHDGTVARLYVAAGEQVERGQRLVEVTGGKEEERQG